MAHRGSPSKASHKEGLTVLLARNLRSQGPWSEGSSTIWVWKPYSLVVWGSGNKELGSGDSSVSLIQHPAPPLACKSISFRVENCDHLLIWMSGCWDVVGFWGVLPFPLFLPIKVLPLLLLLTLKSTHVQLNCTRTLLFWGPPFSGEYASPSPLTYLSLTSHPAESEIQHWKMQILPPGQMKLKENL